MRRTLLRAAAIGGLYAAAAELALTWPLEPEGIAPFWLGGGIALVALLWTPRREWPALAAAIALACLLTNAGAGYPLGQSLGMTSANVVEPLLGAGLLLAVLGGAPSPRRLRDAVALLCLPIPACLAGTVLGTAAVLLYEPDAPAAAVARQWLASDYLGILVVGFIALGLRPLTSGIRLGLARRLEALACYGGLLAACAFVFGVAWSEPQVHHYPLLPVPFAVWATVRFGARGAAAGALLVAGATLAGTLAGRGPFVIPELAGSEPTFAVQAYLAVLVGSMMLLSAALAERTDALELARASERHLENAIESGGLGIWEWFPGTDEVSASDAVFEAFGYAPGEIAPERAAWTALVHPEDRERAESALRTLATGEAESMRTELRIRSRSGGYRWFHSRGVVTRRDEQGAPARVTGVQVDVDALKRTQEQLRHERNFANTVLETIPGLFYVVDRNGRYVRWNRSFSTLLGYSDEDMARLSAFDLVAEEDREAAERLTEEVLRGEVVSMLVRLHARDGETIPFLGTRRAWQYGDEVYVVGVALDMRERLRIEDERRDLEEQLRQSQKLESVGRLAGGIAHDFNNLLTVILGYAEVALTELGSSAGARDAVAQIESAGERARELTRQLLAFSRRQVLEVRELDPNETVESFLPLLARTLPETIEIRTELAPGVGRIRADRGQVEQVLMNLAVNAADAMPEGGRITIRTERARLGEGELPGGAAPAPGDYVRVVFTDTGQGMEAETLEQIFEPFFTTKPYHEGTGLGLATIHGIVKQHGGDVAVESSPGEGTRFDLLLPAAERAAADPEPRGPAARAARRTRSGCILLVEDDRNVRRLVERQVERLGYELLVADGPEGALERAEECRGRIDLLLTDIVMPRMSGPELYERISRENPELRVLYMSGYPADALPRQHAPVEAAVELLQKPFRLADLEARLRALLEG